MILTSSPCLKGRGFPQLTMGGSCFNGYRLQPFRVHRSYAPSAGIECRESLGQHVLRRIGVPVMADSARRTDPFSHIEREFLQDVPAGATGLGGGIPAINLDEETPVPLRLVFQFPLITSVVLGVSYRLPVRCSQKRFQTQINSHDFLGRGKRGDRLLYQDGDEVVPDLVPGDGHAARLACIGERSTPYDGERLPLFRKG